MKNIFLTVISLNYGNEHSQKRFNSKLRTFKNTLRQYDAEGKRAEIKLMARTKMEADEISIEVHADDELLRNDIYNNAALLSL
ncbi:hypothetical protein GCM10023093_23390 [Nemorincola caseinilytica]|uniref:Uncharacterized protein n=1 Tax=Nemorincola caseinilytica TaxID=2054315 RepID=A0ABP8NL33_9BACT